MWQSILRRLATALANTAIVAIVVVALSFLFLEAAPGDPAESLAIARYGTGATTPELIATIRQQEGLDQPVPSRFFRWLKAAVRGDLGRSAVHARPVSTELWQALPPTIELACAALCLSLLLACAVGVLATATSGLLAKWANRGFDLLAVLGVSLPAYWLGHLLILAFAVRLGWLPAAGSAGLASLLLPALTVSLGPAALAAKLLRENLRDVFAQPYIRAARARGLSDSVILMQQALPNALMSVLPLFAVQFTTLLEGAVIVETVFGRPGIGRLLVEAVFARDYPIVQGCLLTLALVCVLVTSCTEVLQILLAPQTAERRATA